MLIYPSAGISSTNMLEELLGDKPIKKDIFSCPQTIERGILWELLNAPCRKVPSKTGTIPDLVSEPIEIKPGLWAAHKMTDTLRIKELFTADKKGLIYISLIADEKRPYGGTKGDDYESLIGTYHFYKKNKPEDKDGLVLEDFSLLLTFYREKPKLPE